MPKAISWRKCVVKFKKLGFEGPFSGGKHLFMVRGTLKVHIPNPHEGDISGGLISRILKNVGISKTEWEKA